MHRAKHNTKILNLKCPRCGGSKFHLEDPNLHTRDVKKVYRAADGAITFKLGPERVEQNERLVLWCTGCPHGFSVGGWDEKEAIRELLDEMEAAGLKL